MLKNNIKLLAILSILFVGCGTYSSTSCSLAPLPKDLTINEYVKYSFDYNNSTKIISATISKKTDDGYFITLENNETTNQYKRRTNCNTQPSNYKLSPEEKYIISGNTGQFKNNNPALSSPIDWVDKGCENTSISVSAGIFDATKCIFITDSNQTKKRKITTFILPDTVNKRPFLGDLKTIIEFQDDSVMTIELLEWNNL